MMEGLRLEIPMIQCDAKNAQCRVEPRFLIVISSTGRPYLSFRGPRPWAFTSVTIGALEASVQGLQGPNVLIWHP